MCAPGQRSHRNGLGAGGDTQPGISGGSQLSPVPIGCTLPVALLGCICESEPLSLLIFIGVCLTVNISLLKLLDINQLR